MRKRSRETEKQRSRESSFFVSLPLCFFASLLLASLPLISFLLTGCTTNRSSDFYKIAVIAPQIGPYEALGQSIINGAELAVDIKNQNGGINGKKIKLIKVDDGGLAGEGTWRAKSLVDLMVLGVIGHLNSDISIPASEIYSKAMITEISPGSTSPLFTERSAVRGYVFRTIGRDDKQGEIAAKHAINKGYKKIAVLYNNRGYGLSLASEFIKQITTSKKSDIIFYESYKVDTQDYSDKINSIQSKSPDLIYFVGEYGDAARFLKKLRSKGLETTFLGSEGVFDKELIDKAKESSEGALVVSLSLNADESFGAEYRKKFNKDIGAYSANSFDATNILISAIEKVKEKDPEKIAQAVRETMDFKGLTGILSFDKKGDLLNPGFSVYEVKNGNFVVIR
ncbi:MAG: hypothetical protein A3B68_03095 [Candidatus Melainabacteria bacterium RIFCSPHIGHO2_02_FULL_34_12]|nr:MAG: hypothetical protein A3B68_03095 [Candidatus Melainabacteria bacterium RIFCSPHIGHO2_02_FULL_34_12]